MNARPSTHALALAVLASFAVPITAPAALVITEWMANPSDLADSTGEYFEVYNTGAPINVSDLTIHDDGTDSIDLIGASEVIGTNQFFVFGRSALFYAEFDYGAVGSFTLGNADDEIVISLTGGLELARVTYSNGDPFGAGVAAVLDSLSSQSGGVTIEPNYVAEVIANNTLPPGLDIGSPGTAGSTTIPEPSWWGLLGLGVLGTLSRRRRRE